jgi:hypothetical protein
LKPKDTKKRSVCLLVNTTPTLPRRQLAGHSGAQGNQVLAKGITPP